MTAMPMPAVSSSNDSAREWFSEHYEELRSRAQAAFRFLGADHREEAVAEVLGTSYVWACRAAERGRLAALTPFWSVTFAAKQYRQGRRLAGYSSSCVMSESARAKRGLRVHSLDEPLGNDGEGRQTPLGSLMDVGKEGPAEVVRRRLDYPMMLGQVSVKARKVLEYLAQTHGAGLQTELAADLGVSAGRVSQLKGELATAFAAEGYHGPLGRRAGAAVQ